MVQSTEKPQITDSDILAGKIHEFENQRQSTLRKYCEEVDLRPLQGNQMLYIFDGREANNRFPLEQPADSQGGYYLKWNGEGIAINPSKGFLRKFHEAGFHIRDIHHVIVTGPSKAYYGDIEQIHTLNNAVNKQSQKLHTIHYYLSPKTYQTLLTTLKPHFKQERETIHCLELFADSPDIESYALAESITLSYFPTGSANTVAIRLKLGPGIQFGYIGGGAWSPLLAHHLNKCDVLITGFGTTRSSDYEKLNYNTNSLGYFGCATLMEEIQPRLQLISEVDASLGDIRLEIAKKLRREPTCRNTIVLPADQSLSIDLQQHTCLCSVTGKQIAPDDVRIVATDKPFGPLRYLSPEILV